MEINSIIRCTGLLKIVSTIIYVHLAVNGRGSMRSPLDRMMEETR
ncbi:MAG: hypothetical protein PUJ25_00815 [Lachnospiraceae bacterium]|nr:hypothetical protein [Lachnospiraceae bacterium]MDY4164486.1 hypothetical protein [Lachnospiraceae bacterium]